MKRTAINDLRHKVKLCSAKDVVSDGELRLRREGVAAVWASIRTVRPSYSAPSGMALSPSRDVPTHRIVMRARHDLIISSTAWVYEARRLSPPRWFKVLAIREDGRSDRMWEMDVRLVEAADDLVTPTPAPGAATATPLPEGVKL